MKKKSGMHLLSYIFGIVLCLIILSVPPLSYNNDVKSNTTIYATDSHRSSNGGIHGGGTRQIGADDDSNIKERSNDGISSLTKIILDIAKIGIGVMGGYGCIRIMKGHASEDTKERGEGVMLVIACVLLEAVVIAVPTYLS